VFVNDPSIRFPLERRRETWAEPSRHDLSYAPFARREGDFARMKLQHWMELGEAALADDPPNRDRPEDDQLLGR
jgi:hypothetical protein